MTLITDGGSTKCDWVLFDSHGEIIFKTETKGLNPTVVPKDEMRDRITGNDHLKNVLQKVKKVEFYGAGCGTSSHRNLLKAVLKDLFVNADVDVSEDLGAAVFAVTAEPGIVCILGTGSNSCYYDGNKIHKPIASLGYVLMDEAGGNYFGKKLIQDYYYKRMPSEIASGFAAKYDLDPDTIKMNLCQKPNPTAYLGSFAEFIFDQDQKNPYFHKMLKKGITDFIECRILTLEKAHEVPIHFVGSIAYFSKDLIAECVKEHNLTLGNIIQRPIDGLIEYYKNKIRN